MATTSGSTAHVPMSHSYVAQHPSCDMPNGGKAFGVLINIDCACVGALPPGTNIAPHLRPSGHFFPQIINVNGSTHQTLETCYSFSRFVFGFFYKRRRQAFFSIMFSSVTNVYFKAHLPTFY